MCFLQYVPVVRSETELVEMFLVIVHEDLDRSHLLDSPVND